MFSIRGSFWIILAFLIAIILGYFFADKPIAIFFHEAPPVLESLSRFISYIINPAPNVLLWSLAFYFVYFILKKENAGNKLLLISISVNAANVVTIPIKMLFGRYRPELWFSENLYGFDFFAFQNRELSFPSGHAVIISAIMFALSSLYPKHFVLFLIIAFILSFARVVIGDHYLSDILASMLIGFVITQFIYNSMKNSHSHFEIR